MKAMIAGALALASVACSDTVLGPPPSTDRAAVFEDVWREFDLHYSFFQLKGIDWTAIGAQYRPLALAAKSEADFAMIVSKMLAELHDPHVSLTPFGAGSTMRYVSPYDTAAMFYNATATLGKYVTAPRRRRRADTFATAASGPTPATRSSRAFSATVGWRDGRSARQAEGRPHDGDRRAQQQRRQSNAGARHRRPVHRSLAHLRIHPLRNGPGHGDFSDYLPADVVAARSATVHWARSTC